jgi:hypothetical protein
MLKISFFYKIIFFCIIFIVTFYNFGYLTGSIVIFNYASMFFMMLIPIFHVFLCKGRINKADILFILFLLYFIIFGTIIGVINSNELRYIIQDNIKILFCLIMLIWYYAWYPKFKNYEIYFILILITFSIIVSEIIGSNIAINFNIMMLIFLIFLFTKYKFLGKLFVATITMLSKKDVYLLNLLVLFFTSIKYKKMYIKLFALLTVVIIIYFYEQISFFLDLFSHTENIQEYTSFLNNSVGSVGDRLFEIYYSINGMHDNFFTKVFGMGNGYSYDMEYTRRLGEIESHRNVHMSIVNLYTKYGWIGVLFFSYLGLKVYNIIINKSYTFYKRALVCIFFISSFFSFTIFNIFIAWSFLSNRSK